MGARRRGSVLLVVLILFLVLTVIFGGAQYLATETYRQTRIALQAQDALHRSDGLVDMLVSRFKKETSYQATSPLVSPPTGAEWGEWDSQEFVMGWERASLGTEPPRHRLAVWISFVDQVPRRTVRYDLELRVPTALEPRVVDVVGVALDPIDPSSAAQRRTAFARLTPDPVQVAAKNASAEVLANRIRQQAAAGRTPAEVEAAVVGPALAPVTVPLRDLLVLQSELAATIDPTIRLSKARQMVAKSGELAPEEAGPWSQLAHFVLACELTRTGDGQVGAARTASFTEAAAELTPLADAAAPECCGAPRAAWQLANLTMRMRADPRDPALLVRTRAEARDRLKVVVDRAPGAPIHPRTDIARRELPDYLVGLWKARVAAGVRVENRGAPTTSSWMLVSMLQDGAQPVVHLEAPGPLSPMEWTIDGGQIFARSDSPGVQHAIWKLALDGSSIRRQLADPLVLDVGSGPPVTTRFHFVSDIRTSPDGATFAYTGLPADPRRPASTLWTGVTVLERGGQVRQLPHMEYDRIGTPMAFGPAGDRFVVLGPEQGGKRSLKVWMLDDFFAGRPAQDLADVPCPGGATCAGLAWERFGARELIALTISPDSTFHVEFFDMSTGAVPPPRTRVPVPTSYSVTHIIGYEDFPNHTQVGTFVQNPPAYLTSSVDAAYLVPLPGSGGAVRMGPSNGRLRGEPRVQVPPWGGYAFLTDNCHQDTSDPVPPDGARLCVMELAGLRSTVLAGPGGLVPGAVTVSRAAVSPIPVE